MSLLSFAIPCMLALFALPSPILTAPSPPIETINIGNATHPQPFYLSRDIKNFGLVNAWYRNPPGPPSWLRSLDLSSVNLLLTTAIYSLSALPANDLFQPYVVVGPESNQRLSSLAMRVTLQPCWTTNVTLDVPVRPLTNIEALAGSVVLQNFYTRGIVSKESASFMCYLSWPQRLLDYCMGVIMVQKDLWYQ